MRVAHMAMSKCSESLHPFIQHTRSPGNIYDKCAYCILKLAFKALALDSLSFLLQESTQTEPGSWVAGVGQGAVEQINVEHIHWCGNSSRSISNTILYQWDWPVLSDSQQFFFFFLNNCPSPFCNQSAGSMPEELIRTLAFDVPLEKLHLYFFTVYTSSG